MKKKFLIERMINGIKSFEVVTASDPTEAMLNQTLPSLSNLEDEFEIIGIYDVGTFNYFEEINKKIGEVFQLFQSFQSIKSNKKQ